MSRDIYIGKFVLESLHPPAGSCNLALCRHQVREILKSFGILPESKCCLARIISGITEQSRINWQNALAWKTEIHNFLLDLQIIVGDCWFQGATCGKNVKDIFYNIFPRRSLAAQFSACAVAMVFGMVKRVLRYCEGHKLIFGL